MNAKKITQAELQEAIRQLRRRRGLVRRVPAPAAARRASVGHGGYEPVAALAARLGAGA